MTVGPLNHATAVSWLVISVLCVRTGKCPSSSFSDRTKEKSRHNIIPIVVLIKKKRSAVNKVSLVQHHVLWGVSPLNNYTSPQRVPWWKHHFQSPSLLLSTKKKNPPFIQTCFTGSILFSGQTMKQAEPFQSLKVTIKLPRSFPTKKLCVYRLLSQPWITNPCSNFGVPMAHLDQPNSLNCPWGDFLNLIPSHSWFKSKITIATLFYIL